MLQLFSLCLLRPPVVLVASVNSVNFADGQWQRLAIFSHEDGNR